MSRVSDKQTSPKLIKRDKEGHFVFIIQIIHQDDTTILNR